MKIIINNCFGGFGFSDKAIKMMIERGLSFFVVTEKNERELYNRNEFIFDFSRVRKNDHCFLLSNYEINDNREKEIRTNEIAITIIEELGIEANGALASLKIIEIPNSVEWEIEEYDGIEWVSEKHRRWN